MGSFRLKINRIFILLILCGGLARISPVLAGSADYALVPEHSRLNFSVHSTLHEVEGIAKRIDGKPVSFDELNHAVGAPVSISIPVESLETGNGRRDKAMLKMFESERYPEILWQSDRIQCDPSAAPQSWRCGASGKLRIRDIEKEAVMQIDVSLHGNKIRAQSAILISLKDYKLKPPSVFGIIRVSDEVRVAFDTTWEREKK